MSVLAENPNCSETHADLRFVGPLVDPSEITSMLGLAPTFKIAVGESPRPDDPRYNSRSEGIWLLSSEGSVSSTDLEIHLRWLIDQLPASFAETVRELRSVGTRCEVLCAWHSATGHGGPVISPDVIARLAPLGLELQFDFYSDV